MELLEITRVLALTRSARRRGATASDCARNVAHERKWTVRKRQVEAVCESDAGKSVDELRAKPIRGALGPGALWRQEATPLPRHALVGPRELVLATSL